MTKSDASTRLCDSTKHLGGAIASLFCALFSTILTFLLISGAPNLTWLWLETTILAILFITLAIYHANEYKRG